jgi:hypothetical protein
MGAYLARLSCTTFRCRMSARNYCPSLQTDADPHKLSSQWLFRPARSSHPPVRCRMTRPRLRFTNVVLACTQQPLFVVLWPPLKFRCRQFLWQQRRLYWPHKTLWYFRCYGTEFSIDPEVSPPRLSIHILGEEYYSEEGAALCFEGGYLQCTLHSATLTQPRMLCDV